MKLRRSSGAAVALLLAGAPVAAAQSADDPLREADAGAAEEGALFLLVPVGARATALGQAAVADGASSEAAFWNPAGLAHLTQSEFAVHYARTFVSNNTAVSGYVTASRVGVFGAAAYLVDLGTQSASGIGGPTGSFSTKNIELLASYATPLTRDLLFGVNYKLIQHRQECSGDCGVLFQPTIGTTHAVDVGAQYALGSRDDLTIGVALQHAGFKLQLKNRDQADPLPTRVQVGFQYRVHLPTPEGVQQGLDARLLVDLQDAWGSYSSPDARVGVEVGVGETVRLRSGYAFLDSGSGGPSVGIGIRAGRITIDFAQVFLDQASFDEPVHISLRAEL